MGEAVALATDEVAEFVVTIRLLAVAQVQKAQPHPSPSAPPSPILGEGYNARRVHHTLNHNLSH